METQSEKRGPKGGEFLVMDSDQQTVFVPEELDEEQFMISEVVHDFVKQNLTKFDNLEDQAGLLEQAAALGMVGAHIPEAYGGMEMDKNAVTVLLESMGYAGGSFNTTFAAHTGIGMLPILYFGTVAQKEKYLPKLCTAEYKAAYCLTEPGSGSDALAAKTHAVLNAAGTHYLLNGQKMWITNAGFADVFIVFAKIDGTDFTGFIVDANLEGIILGDEEKKLGIKASSTRQVFFENVQVPVENLLGEKGKGHLIAFNVLNIGRFKLGNLSLGGIKNLINIGIEYANERKQFGEAISSFGAIQYKIAEQLTKGFALESAVYRVSNLLKMEAQEQEAAGKSFEHSLLEAAEEYAIECAILKVYGSEALDYVVDETLQIHGGYGFSEEYLPAKAYRDARINRIYEGTNEINRLLSVRMLLKRVMKGELDMVDKAWAVQKELTKMPSFNRPTGYLAEEDVAVANFKKTALMTAGAAVKYQMDGKLDLAANQQLISFLADLLIDIYMAESLYLRVHKIKELNKEEAYLANAEDMLRLFLHDAQDRVAKTAKDTLVSFAGGDELKIMLMGIQRFSNYTAQNVAHLRTKIAQRAIEEGAHTLAI